jgi:hypothetical protein
MLHYSLQLPYRRALPLMALSGTLHWLCSQSISLVAIQFDHTAIGFDSKVSSGYKAGVPEEYLTCGYSPAATLATTLLGIFMVAFVWVMARRIYKNGGMPIAGSCSASISACCHQPETAMGKEKEGDAAYLPVRWGVTGSLDTNMGVGTERVGHCSFSSGGVDIPEKGVLYAGLRERRSAYDELR